MECTIGKKISGVNPRPSNQSSVAQNRVADYTLNSTA